MMMDMKVADIESRKACCYDNAAMGSFFATLKNECAQNRIPKNRAQARAKLFDCIETFYNPKRLHSALDYLSSLELEKLLNHPTYKTTTCPDFRRQISTYRMATLADQAKLATASTLRRVIVHRGKDL